MENLMNNADNSLRSLLDSCISEISRWKTSGEAVTEGKEKELEKLRSDLSLLKKIMGNYHPTDKSLTYREIMDENHKLKSGAEEAEKTISELSSKVERLMKEKEVSEQETIQLRQKIFPHQQPQQSGKNKHKKSFWQKRKDKKAASLLASLSEAEKRDRLREHLFSYSRYYTDLQIAFLSGVLENEKLPAGEMAKLFNPLMSTTRMEQFYALLCSKYHIPLQPSKSQKENARDAKSSSTSSENNYDNSTDNKESVNTSPVFVLEPESQKPYEQKKTLVKAAAVLTGGTGKRR